MQDLQTKCRAFNSMYRLPIADKPGFHKLTEPVGVRISNFRKTLADEVAELDEIDVNKPEIDVLVEIADLLGDVCVYCTSEAVKYGIPLEEVLNIIMASNMSKLGENGEPIYNEEGKVMKGPGYWKPEFKIRELLVGLMTEKKKEKDEAAKWLEKNEAAAS